MKDKYFSLLSYICLVLIAAATGCGASSSVGGGAGQSGDETSDGAGQNDAETANDSLNGDARDASADLAEDDAGSGDIAPASDTLPAKAPTTIDSLRPASVTVPKDWAAKDKWPLIVLLHGYSVTGAIQDIYMGVSARASKLGFVAVIPDGTPDSSGKLFWNATPACCNFGGIKVDDVAYISGLIDKAIAELHVDPARVYIVGHSNGAFMALRLACEIADKVTAVASLAGAADIDLNKCAPSQAVSVLQIHGTLDAVIAYKGGSNLLAPPFPGAETTVLDWRTHDACSETKTPMDDADYDSILAGNETKRTAWTDCKQGTRVDFWRIEGGAHIPTITDTFRDDLLQHLLARTRSSK